MPIACIYCQTAILPKESAVVVTKTSLDQSKEPDFDPGHKVTGIAHPDCWERERPDTAEA